jgi:hypothetical protein
MLSLSQEEARAHILVRQGLSRPFANPIDALQGIFAIQTQYASSLPIALGFRVQGLKSTWHKRAENQAVLKSWTLRSTLHAHTASDHAIAVAALRDRLRTRYVEWFKKDLGFDDASIQRMEEEICNALDGQSLTRVELHEQIPSLRNIPYSGWGLDLKGLAFAGRIKLIVAESGATRFTRHECPENWEKDQAIAELMRRYFFAFGPASLADFRYWSGLFAVDIKRAFALVERDFEQVSVVGLAGVRYIHGGLESAPISKVLLLAKFDPLTLGHLDKTLFLPSKDREKVFRKAGQVEAGILIDGKFAGTWRLARKGKYAEVAIEPFTRIAKSRIPAIEREGRKAARSVGLKLTGVNFVP